MQYPIYMPEPEGHIGPIEGVVYVNQILHKQGCAITNLFPVEVMLWQLRMRNNNHKHTDRICTVILAAD